MVTIYNNDVKCHQLPSLLAITDELLFVKDLGQNSYKALFFSHSMVQILKIFLWITQLSGKPWNV